MTKAITDFSGYAAAVLIPVAQAIQGAMTIAAVTFPTPTTAMPALQTMIGAFEAKLAAKNSGAKAATIAFNASRDVLEEALGALGDYVNSVAKGDPAIVVLSGFPSYETTGHGPDTAPPAAPADLVVRQGDLSGSAIARYRPARPRSVNEVQTCAADPNVEANWKTAEMFSGGKAELKGIVPGTVLWVRVRTVGLKGVMGAWSDPAKIMVV